MVAQRDYFEREQKPAAVPIWRESLMAMDWLALRYSPVYWGWSVPHGDGAAVILVPGFLATDFYLQEMYWWLARVGYRPYTSQIGRNAECLDVLATRLTSTLEKAQARTGRPVHLIGHSLGGILSRSVAERRPELVASVVTLASPFRGISSHPVVLEWGNAVRQRIQLVRGKQVQPACFTGACNCPTASALRNGLPASIGQTAIYTKSDGIVDWRRCVTDQPTNNFEVSGTHGGLAFNPLVYEIIARRLAAQRV